MNIDMSWHNDVNSICVFTVIWCNNMKIGYNNIGAVNYTNMSFWTINMCKST